MRRARRSRFTAWIYHTRMVWTHLVETWHRQRRWSALCFTPFLSWYAPLFSAYSFTLARAQEYEADRQAARVVGTGDLMDALLTKELLARMIDERYWPAINRRTVTDPMPPASHLEELTALFHRLPSPQTIHGWMNEALHGNTGYADTHPSLADRLAALRAHADDPNDAGPTMPQLRKGGEPSAADLYLGTYLTAVREALDDAWVESVTDEWEHKHREMAAARARCQELSDKSATVGLSINELWEYACQMEALESGRAALPLLQRLLAKDPTHAQANLALGRLLLAQGDSAGLAHLEQAVAQDRSAVIPACTLASAFLEQRGQHKEALRYRAALAQAFQILKERPITTRTAVDICRTIKGVALDIRATPGTALLNEATGEVVYTPPQGQDLLRQKLADWERYLHTEDGVDPLIKLGVLHYQFEAIHPFTDGNGRTGRVLNLLYLVEKGLLDTPTLYLSRYIIQHKSAYYSGLLKVTTDEAWEPWLLFMIEAVRETAIWTTAKIGAIRALLEQHFAGMLANSPKDSCHFLDFEGLKGPGVTFWSIWAGDSLAGCGALREIAPDHGEVPVGGGTYAIVVSDAYVGPILLERFEHAPDIGLLQLGAAVAGAV